MPYDSNGNFTLNAGYLAVAGQVIQPSQHNPPLEDLAANGLSNVVVRDGRAAMTGDLKMGGFKVRNIGDGSLSTDAVSKGQLDGRTTRGYLFGLTLSNNAVDAVNDIDIAVGAAASDDVAPPFILLGSVITKRLDAAWALGSGAGGLDTGAIANTTYHVWLIQRSDTGVVDALFSTSATAPTMPTNYDRKRRIGSIIRSGATILAFRQFNNRFMLASTVTARSSTAAFADALLAVSTPAGIRTRPILTNVLSVNAASSVQNSFGDGDGSAAQFAAQAVTNGVADVVIVDQVYTNTSSQIRYLCQINSGTIVANTLNCAGWWDDRGING